MRVLGFSRKSDKLNNDTFTTFRYGRGDKRDWQIGELVQIVITPRSKERIKLGIAKITSKEVVELNAYFAEVGRLVTDTEAIADGFSSRKDMIQWMQKTYGLDYVSRMNKLTLKYTSKKEGAK